MTLSDIQALCDSLSIDWVLCNDKNMIEFSRSGDNLGVCHWKCSASHLARQEMFESVQKIAYGLPESVHRLVSFARVESTEITMADAEINQDIILNNLYFVDRILDRIIFEGNESWIPEHFLVNEENQRKIFIDFLEEYQSNILMRIEDDCHLGSDKEYAENSLYLMINLRKNHFKKIFEENKKESFVH